MANNNTKIIVVLFFMFLTTSTWATNIRVCGTCEVKSITAGIALAQPGDTLIVAKGIYKEGNIFINKSIVLIGEDYPVVDGENNNEIFTILADSVTLSGFQIQNVGISYTKDRAGINVVKGHYVTITNNKLFNTFFGIYLQKSSYGTIKGNWVEGNAIQEMSSGNAIHLWHCKNMTVTNNTAIKHRDGIYLEFVDHALVINNMSKDNIRYGLHFMFSNNDRYVSNTFKNNGAGVAVMFSKNIAMIGNRFEHNWGTAAYGLLLKEIYDGEIKDNVFSANTTAIYGESATRVVITNNTFEYNGWALRLGGSCMDNTINRNNFYYNTFDVASNNPRNYNDYTGNYWHDYSGYDLDKDGIGDVPHRPVKLFSYIVSRSESSIILLRSLFIDLLNFAEKVTPVFTPTTLVDDQPLMKPVL